MLDQLFLQILNMSFTGSIVIILVLMVRLLLKKAPKVFSYGLWSVVLFRLICPFSFESIFSLLPTKATPISEDILYMEVPKIDTGITVINNAVNTVLPSATPYAGVNPIQIWIFIGSFIWILGIIVLLGHSLFTLLHLKKNLQNAKLYKDNIFISQNIKTAFVMGFFRPQIYLPTNLNDSEREYILLHERTHIKHFDHIIKLISFLVLCIHWFNPFVWVAFFVSSRDMEMACDEAVIKQLGNDVKKDYSSSLLTLTTGRRVVGGTPLAFGEGDTKTRIKNVLNYQKPAFWVLFVTAVIVIGVALGLMSNRKEEETYPTPENETQLQPIENDTKIYSESTEDLWNARTQYVGDNSAVGKLIGLLPIPEGLEYDHFKLHTTEQPYTIEIVYSASTETLELLDTLAKYDTDDTSAIGILKKNALILLALVDNAEGVSSVLTDGTSEVGFHYGRQWAEESVNGDIRDYAVSPEQLQELINGFQSISNAESTKEQVKDESPLTQATHNAILEQNKLNNRQNNIAYESHVVLATETDSESITVYAMVLYEEYSLIDGKFDHTKMVGGSHIATALTFDIEANDEYLLREYWEPQPGSYHNADIKSKFPEAVWQDALNTQKYIYLQKQSIYNQIIDDGYINPENMITSIIDEMWKTANTTSDWRLQSSRNELTYYGDYMLLYAYDRFLEGNQTDEKGKIMETACRIILNQYNEDIDYLSTTGQDWFDTYLASLQEREKKEGMVFIRENMPKGYLLLNYYWSQN